jgi:hypothetical protein
VVASGDVGALIADITTANSDNQVDIINLTNNGSYTFTQANNTTNGPNALPVILSHNLTIFGNGSVLDAPPGPSFGRFFTVASKATLYLEGMTLRNGLAQGQPSSPPNGQFDQGGAILNAGGNVTLDKVNIASCSAAWTNGHGGRTAATTGHGQSGTPIDVVPGPAQGGGIYSVGGVAEPDPVRHLRRCHRSQRANQQARGRCGDGLAGGPRAGRRDL